MNDVAAAIDELRADSLDAAETLLARALEQEADRTDALHFMGLLRHAQGRPGEAISLIRDSLARQPANTGAWNNLGNVCLLAGRTDDAADAYAHAIEHADAGDADSALALANLGALYRKLGRLSDSERACRRAVEIAPGCGDAWYQLSATLIRVGRVHDGLLAHSKAVALWPELLQSRGEIVRALLVLGERKRASRLLREWLDSDPGNAVAEHLLAACDAADGVPVRARASDAYVQQVFDSFAASFDAKLEALHYRAPQLVAAALREMLPAPAAQFDIADLGCGTGLVGPLLRPWARRLVGCDLSVGMLRRAKARGGYDALHQAELVYYLATQPGAFDVVVSADTLCYFGDLHAALAAAARALRPGGWLVFTVEAWQGVGEGSAVRLNPCGRYAHGELHVREAAAAALLHVHSLAIDTLRDEAGQSVRGWLVVLHKKA